jgi:hypothetical protein
MLKAQGYKMAGINIVSLGLTEVDIIETEIIIPNGIAGRY